MSTSAQTAQPVKYKRSIKNYLLDARFQLKWTGFIIGVALIVSGIMGFFLAQSTENLTRESQKVIASGQELIKESQKNSDLVKMNMKEQYADAPELAAAFNKQSNDLDANLKKKQDALMAQQQATIESQHTMIRSLVLGLGALVVFIGVLGIYFTHKVVGPIHMMKGLLRQVGDGKLNFNRKPRKGDELQDFFEVFQQMVNKLKDRQQKEVDLLTAAIEETQERGGPQSSDEALAKIMKVRDEMKAALDV